MKNMILMLAILAVSAMGYSQPGKKWLIRGLSKFDHQVYDEAIMDYTKALKENPRLAEAYYHRGLAKRALNLECTGIFINGAGSNGILVRDGRANTSFPVQTGIYNTVGLATVELRDSAETMEILNDALKINPKDARAYFNRGAAKRACNNHRGAIDDFTAAVNINPGEAEAFYNRGASKKELRDCPGAISDYSRAIDIDPGYAEAYCYRGMAKFDIKDYTGAVADFTQALELNPLMAVAYSGRGEAREALGDYEGAMTDRAKSLSIEPEYETVPCDLGGKKYFLQIFYGEIDDYSKAIEINPAYADAYYNRGIAKIKIQRKESGCIDLKKAADLGNKEAGEQMLKFCR